MEEILAEAAGEVRRIEKLADQLLGVVRHLEDCQDPDELREAASTIEDVSNWLHSMVGDLEDIARRAEEAGEEEDEEEPDDRECSKCGRLLVGGATSEHDDTGICEDCVG